MTQNHQDNKLGTWKRNPGRAKQFIENYPQAAEAEVVGIVYTKIDGRPALVVYVHRPGALIGTGGEVAQELYRQLGGYYRIIVRHFSEMTPEDRQQILIAQKRCPVCRGSHTTFCPSITLYGVLWKRVPCPACEYEEEE